MFGIFKSAKQKQDEANFQLIAKGMHELARQNLLGIEHANTKFDARQRHSVARGIYLAPIDFDRTMDGVKELERVIRTIDAKAKIQNDKLQAEYSFGLGLGYRMISAGTLMLRVDGSYWMDLAVIFAQIEGSLRGFLESNNFEVWPVNYVEDFAFEAFRRDFAEKEKG